MKKSFLGWSAIVFLSLFPVMILFALGSQKDLTSFRDITHALGQITGLVGMTLFALTFIFSTRLRFLEDIFGGLDKVYKVHALTGSISLSLLLFHPILLVLKFVPADISLAASFLLLSDHSSVNYGIFALIGMTLLIYLTFFSNLKYQLWKFTHEFLGLFFILAILHVFLVRDTVAQDYIFRGYYIYAAIVSIIGLLGFFYSLILRNKIARELYQVESIEISNDSFFDINMVALKKPIKYMAGQFVFVSFFNKKVGREPHPFSIASRSGSRKIRIIAKNLGDYTDRLRYVQKGDKVKVEGPYGRFFREMSSDQIWLAGGIGITPFIGMAQDMGKDSKYRADLFYTSRKKEDFVGLDTLREAERACHKFKLHQKITDVEGYLTVDEILKKTGPAKGKEIFVCGPNQFKELMVAGFLKAGVTKEMIHLEDFNFR
jgi:predicted ferric reductase